MRSASSIQAHYSQPALAERIVDALARAGVDPGSLTREDIARLDEFHTGGREATRELARLAGLHQGMDVLDIGSGIGGPARTLAAEFGCTVSGVDLVEEFCRTATLLSEYLDLDAKTSFRHADALDLPFAAGAFDIPWLQHATMNIEDKPRLFREIRRVLRPGGRLALHEVCAGPAGSPRFPVPWAGDPSISFLLPEDAVQRLLDESGLQPRVWRDVTAAAQQWFRNLIAAADRSDEAPAVSIALLMGPQAPQKLRNLVLNLDENRVRLIQAVLEPGDA